MNKYQELTERQEVIRIARTWLGTPFHDQQCVRGAGVDCALLVAAVFEEAGLCDHVDIGHYSPQWFLHRDEERYLSYVLPRAIEINETDAISADLVVYKIGRCYAHGAIINNPGWPHIIHAYKPYGMVLEGLGDDGELKVRAKKFFRYNGWANG